MRRDFTEEAVEALHPVHQRRMARLVLSGWEIKHSVGRYTDRISWTAVITTEEAARRQLEPFALRIYSAGSLMGLLDQMVGVAEACEAPMDPAANVELPDEAKLPPR